MSNPTPELRTTRHLDTEGMSDKADECANRMALYFDTYKRHVKTDEDDNALTDILADLMHFADAAGLDFGAALMSADSNYSAEAAMVLRKV